MEQIKGYEGLYEIHLNKQQVWNVRRKEYKKNQLVRGYPSVILYKEGKYKNFYIHKLIAEYFINNPENKKCVDHIDRDRTNNNVQNLRWVTGQENNWNCKSKNYYYSKRDKYWQVTISLNNKTIYGGTFSTEEEAMKKANELKASLHHIE